MSHNISINVPYNRRAVSAAARMLAEVAESFNEPATKSPLVEEVADSSGMAPEHIDPNPKKVLTEADAKADLAGDPRPDNPSVEEQDAKEVFAAPAPDAAAPVVDVDLDANDLPWDARIHASSKTKDVKGNWKYKRGVDRDVLVPEVEAELRESMGAIPEPETGAVNVPPAPVVETAPPPPLAEASTPGNPTGIPAPDTGTPSVNVTTFAQLVTAITANSIDETRVKEALDKVRIGNFALLGARPDLIPAVAGHLGL